MLRAFGNVEQGGSTVNVSVASGAYTGATTGDVQKSFPGATVTVYLTGTLTTATIYSDNGITPLANPFTATQTGYWFFYAANGRYDVKFSGAGVPVPFTLGDISLSDPGGVATGVTSWGPLGNSRTGAVIPATNDYTLRQIQNVPFLNVLDFNFAPQAPGTSLSPGANVITLTPVPPGVNGADGSHYLYISGGTGAAEAVLITGGTAVSGGASGTVIVNCANSHSGAWTIASASGGLREAIIYGGTGADIRIPANTTLTLYAQLVIDQQFLTISGAGKSSSLVIAGANANINSGLIYIGTSVGAGLTLRNFALDGNRANNGTNNANGACVYAGATFSTSGIDGVSIIGMECRFTNKFGIEVAGPQNRWLIRECYIHDNGGPGGTDGGVGIYFVQSGANPFAEDVQIIGNHIEANYPTAGAANFGGGILISAYRAIVSGNFFKNNYNGGGQVAGAMEIVANNQVYRTTPKPNGNAGGGDNTTGIECVTFPQQVTGNIVIGHDLGGGIVLQGNPLGPGGEGSGDMVVADNYVLTASVGISLLNAGGTIRAVIIANNRIAAGLGGGVVGLQIDTAAGVVSVIGNNFIDCTTFVVDNTTYGVLYANNLPFSVNKLYLGIVPSAASITMAASQVATITGATNINTISLKPVYAGAVGAGIQVTLIPAAGSTWRVVTGGNIGNNLTPVVGIPVILVFDGTLWWAK
ncbi:MAG TPA: hypothetical protein VKQ11_00435 [Candidatus Sulfotelmatobacter sp.]|nr:hypothetical protein [Candidatus Sulfotelmatobacter sp.]